MSRWTAPMQALVSTLSRGARRDIENASPVPLTARNRSRLFTYLPNDSMIDYLGTYLNDPVIRPIVARIFQAVTEPDWHLYVKSRTGTDQDRTEITSHAVLDLIQHPNNFQTWAEIIARGQQHWELVGETSIVLGFQPGIKYPIDMWVLRPDRIQPVPDPYAYLAGWIYQAPGDNEKIPLEVGELLRMVDPSPVDPYRGAGAVQALLRDLDAQRYTKEWQASFFANSAQPGGMLQVDRRLTDEEFDEMMLRWEQTHRGISKSHRVAILEQANWIDSAFSLRDLQMAELESLGRDKTLAAFGMPKSVIGVVEDVNRANAEAGEYLFARWMTRPRLNNWRQMLNHQLLPFFDPRGQLELDFDDPVPENSEANIAELNTKAGVVVELVGAGFDADAVLEMVDWPDLGYEKPEPTVVHVPQPSTEQGSTTPSESDKLPRDPSSDMIRVPSRLGDQARELVRAHAGRMKIDNAMRWRVVGHPDDNCCEPCRENIGTLYRNRSSAYADYPPGEGYIKCIGRQYGNKCRCKVVKRRNGRG